jgi:hypothetical protein
MKKRRIRLTFVVNDDGDASPDYIAQRVAQACFDRYVLRGDEGVVLPSNSELIIRRADV